MSLAVQHKMVMQIVLDVSLVVQSRKRARIRWDRFGPAPPGSVVVMPTVAFQLPSRGIDGMRRSAGRAPALVTASALAVGRMFPLRLNRL